MPDGLEYYLLLRYSVEDMAQFNTPREEEKILEFWKKENIFKRSVEARKKGKPFVFYEGPPTANGKPGIHHVIGRAYKDIILRYKTMQGFWVWRRAGWDTHGLPVELEVEKELGLSNKKEIEEYGIAAFNAKCRESVWRYKKNWEDLTERMGFWVDMGDPYITYNARYIENLWAVLKKFWDKKLLFKDFKVVPYCVRCGTPISSHEVAQGYETVTDKSVYVKFKVKNQENTYILAWTTTPWTLPGNVALAVGEDIDYLVIEHGPIEGNPKPNVSAGVYIIAKDALKHLVKFEEFKEIFPEYSDYLFAKKTGNQERLKYYKDKWKIIKGKDLVGLSYKPLFDVPELKSEKSYKVYPADFVSTQEGTGIVHTAVMYGVEDFELGSKIGLPKVHTVGEDGKFVDSVPLVGGKSIVKDNKKNPETESLIIEDLKIRKLLFKVEDFKHEYPFCWRCHSPLLYYARESWFVGTSSRQKELLKNNEKINWVPEHIKNGRFGEWLREVKDWAISRERY